MTTVGNWEAIRERHGPGRWKVKGIDTTTRDQVESAVIDWLADWQESHPQRKPEVPDGEAE